MTSHPMPYAQFAYSRNPLNDLLLSDPETNRHSRWFEARGLKETLSFWKGLAKLGRVDRAEIRTEEDRLRDDALGTIHVSRVWLFLKIRGFPPLDALGVGRSGSVKGARLAALGEALERFGLRLAGSLVSARREKRCLVDPRWPHEFNSNGVSFHTSPVQLMKGALFEIIERDAFLANWYSDRALPSNPIEPGHFSYKHKQSLEKQGWRIHEHCWHGDELGVWSVWYSLISQKIEANQWNFFLGGAASTSYEKASIKALSEVLGISRFVTSKFVPDTSFDVKYADLRGTEARLFLYQKPYFVRRFLDRLAVKKVRLRTGRKELSDRDFVLGYLKHNRNHVNVTPLILPGSFVPHAYLVKVEDQKLQDADWHLPPRYNLERIKAKYGTMAANLNRIPHPIA